MVTCHIKFQPNVRVARKQTSLWGEGRAYLKSPKFVSLGQAGIHHCMRSSGRQKKALDLMKKSKRRA